MNFNPEPFQAMALLRWAAVFGVFLLATIVIGVLVSLAVHRGRGLGVFWRELKRLAGEAVSVSPRRIGALTMLTFREATRRKSLLVFVVFAFLFMFAGWFLSDTNERPELQVKVYVSFVLTAITFLVLPVMLLLSCWGIPEDIKVRSLHTVVTKPVRRHEVYLGRIFGFSLIGTLLVVLMGGVGYVWIQRQLPKSVKDKELVCRVPVYGELSFLNNEGQRKTKGINVGDVWEFRSFIPGNTKARAVWTFENVTAERMGNELHLESRFEVFRTHKGNQGRGVMCEYHFVKDLRSQTAYDLASARGFEVVKQKLQDSDFKSAAFELKRVAGGLDSDALRPSAASFKSISSGYAAFAKLLEPFEKDDDAEWVATLRRQAMACSRAGGSRSPGELASALKELAATLDGRSQKLPELLVDVEVRHSPPFPVSEFRESQNESIKPDIEYKINGKDERHQGNLFKDLVHGGQLKVQLKCLESGQYVGMARPDMFIRLPDRDFSVGYAKAVAAIWLLMLLVVILSVTASTFLKGPVATLLTFVLLILGSPFHDFLEKMAKDEVTSAGVVGSAVRLINHQNPRTEISQTQGTLFIDNSLHGLLKGVFQIVPDFDNYRATPYVANGFDVPWSSALLPSLMTTLAFLIPCLVLGYLSLAKRELEEK
ncbi:MAG: ABC transporter permease [Planctomycetaceae bacterium]